MSEQTMSDQAMSDQAMSDQAMSDQAMAERLKLVIEKAKQRGKLIRAICLYGELKGG